MQNKKEILSHPDIRIWFSRNALSPNALRQDLNSLKKICSLFLFVGFLILFHSGYGQSYVPEKQNSRVRIKPVVPIHAYAFNLRDIRLLNGPFKHAMQMDAAYLLLLDPNRLLHRFYTNAHLPDKGAVYGGWESEGLSGHTLGHYLSACSMQAASTADTRYRERVQYIVHELAKCRNARHTGYIGAIPGEDSLFARVSRGEIKSSGFDLNGGWSPWYTVHKLMAGLLDAYLYCDNREALELVKGMGDWTEGIVAHLSNAQRQLMLRCEYGGMNDVLANLYSVTGNRKYLRLSYLFHDDFVLSKLAKQIDPLPGKHSNTNVPKAIGCARRYELTGADSDRVIATFFWQSMVHHHSYVIGGNSNYEYCGNAGQLNDQLSDNTCETCNTYNMLKLTRHLFSWQPDAAYGDYYERALYNHILASQNPDNGMMCYFVPLRMGAQKEFSDSFNTFTCCVGSGMENHTKYTEHIFSEGNDGSLFVNLFIASELNWRSKEMKVRMETEFPKDSILHLRLSTKKQQRFALQIRKPGWAKNGMDIFINGKKTEYAAGENGYIRISRTWKEKDHVEIHFSLSIYAEPMPDNVNRVALLYGPLVLAGELGKQKPDPVYGIPVLLTDNRNPAEWIKPAGNGSLAFTMQGTGKPFDAKLIPFYQMVNQHYSVYWDYFTREEWAAREKEYKDEIARQADIESRTIDYFRIGEMQPERDHHLQAGERSYVSDALGRQGREARSGSYFSFDLKIDSNADSILITYISDDKDRIFDISVDGKLLTTQQLDGGKAGKFFDLTYKIPNEFSGKKSITIRIDANHGKTAGRIFGVRVIR